MYFLFTISLTSLSLNEDVFYLDFFVGLDVWNIIGSGVGSSVGLGAASSVENLSTLLIGNILLLKILGIFPHLLRPNVAFL